MSATLSAERRRRMLITALGEDIAAAMRLPDVVEIMVNPDGALRLDRLGEGRVDTEVRLAPDQVERIIRLVASHARAEVHAEHPIISAELPPHIEGRRSPRPSSRAARSASCCQTIARSSRRAMTSMRGSASTTGRSN